jgi:hypothetical protein
MDTEEGHRGGKEEEKAGGQPGAAGAAILIGAAQPPGHLAIGIKSKFYPFFEGIKSNSLKISSLILCTPFGLVKKSFWTRFESNIRNINHE